MRAYGLDRHRHQPEIEQELGAVGIAAPLVFTPHVVPLKRGMLADCYAFFKSEPSEATIVEALYEGFTRRTRSCDSCRQTKRRSLIAVAGTNDAELHVSVRGRVVRVLSALDNLGKGAAGEALQNLNIMFGYPEECALDACAIVV